MRYPGQPPTPPMEKIFEAMDEPSNAGLGVKQLVEVVAEKLDCSYDDVLTAIESREAMRSPRKN